MRVDCMKNKSIKKFFIFIFILLLGPLIYNVKTTTLYAESFVGAGCSIPSYRLVTLKTQKGSDVSAFEFFNELSPEEIINCAQEVSDNYPNVIKLADASRKYNCHSYAWHNRYYTQNKYWINDPTIYHEDGSFYEGVCAIGNIVAYIDANGKNIHSGVITAISNGPSYSDIENADLLTVKSKWGDYGLYSHNGNDCPYVRLGSGGIDGVSNPAVELRYYKHMHYDATYVDYDYDYHKVYCGFCDDVLLEPHHWVPGAIYPDFVNGEGINYIPIFVCYYCDKVSNLPPY